MYRLLVIVFLSGAASLVQQVSWTRRLASVTSATSRAQGVILAVFFAGLAIGAVWPGQRAARARRPLLGYASVEGLALLCAIASIPTFSTFDRVRAAASRWGASPSTALALEIAVAGAFLLVPSALMGASLPFVVEEADRRHLGVGRRRLVATLYGVNTLGAAAGCALAGFVLVERVGLQRTTWVGAALAALASGLALLPVRAATTVVSTRQSPSAVEATSPGAPSTIESLQPGDLDLNAGITPILLLSAALAGLVGVGAEVVWTRLFSLVVFNTVYAFTQVLLAVLVGVAMGAALAAAIVARSGDDVRRPLRAAALTQVGAAIAMTFVAPVCGMLSGHLELGAAVAAGRSSLGALALFAVIVVPVSLGAATLPLVVAAVGRARTSRAFGFVYAANTAGSVVGSLLAGFVLLPLLGAIGTSIVLEVAALCVACALFWAGSERRRDAFVMFVPVVAVAAVHALFPEGSRRIHEARLPEGTKILEIREGVASDVMVTESESGQRRIWINSSWVAGTGGGHRALGHLPALFVQAPRRAVGIALGTGQTFAAAFAHGVTHLDVVEIDPEVISLSRRWFGEANDHLLDHPAVHVHQDDGRAFLRATDARFDLVVLEPLQAWSAGTSSLYSREFYRDARRVLASGGVVAQWIPLYGQGVDETRAMVHTALDVFPEATLWLDERDAILLLHDRPPILAGPEIDARIAARGLAPDLSRKSLVGSVDVLALLVLDPEGVRRWTEGAAMVTDDRPWLEFVAARQLGIDSYGPLLASIARARDATRPEARAIVGDTDLAKRADVASRALVADAAAPPDAWLGRARLLELAIAGAPTSHVVRMRYRRAMDGWARAAIAAGPAEVERVLRRAVEHDDGFGDAMMNLALLAASRNDPKASREWLVRATNVEETRLRAQSMLTALP